MPVDKKSNKNLNNRWVLLASALFLLSITLFIAAAATFPLQLDLFARLNPKDDASAQSVISLTVDPAVQVNQFNDAMRGVSFVNWDHNWGRPFVGQVPGLTAVLKEIRPGLLRYAGGLVANNVGWDRTTQKRGAVEWRDSLGNVYDYHYGTDEMEDLNAFSDALNADVMIQVNIAENNPAMWADMVRYSNKERGWNFKYWELGNELDHDQQQNVSPEESGRRSAEYQKAMLAVDSSIGIRGPANAWATVQAGPNTGARIMSQYITELLPAVKNAGKDLNGLTWHWYQQCNNASGIEGVTQFTQGAVPREHWLNSFYRDHAKIYTQWIENEILAPYPNTLQGVTELNVDACDYESVINGNHIAALWFADVLGRLAYNGLDFVTMYEGYATQGYAMVYGVGDPPTRVALRPTYYPYLMYSKYFGDRMVKSASSDEAKLSVWASTDTKDPGKLKLMVTNMTADNLASSLSLGAFRATGGSVYQMKSTNPTDMSATSNTESATTTINNVKLNPSSIAASVAQIQPVNLPVNGSQFSYTFPAWSVTSIVLSSNGTPIATAPPTATATPRPTSIAPTPSGPVNPLAADINNDGRVNIFDLGILSGHYGRATSSDPNNQQLQRSDVNRDGTVNVFDLGILVSSYESAPVPTSSVTPITRQQVVYDNQLQGGAQNASWGTTLKFGNTNPVRSGNSLAMTLVDAWGALRVSYPSGIDLSSFSHLRFWVHGGDAGNQALQLYFYDAGNTAYQRYQLPLLKAREWMMVEVPFSSLGNPSSVSGFILQSSVDRAQPIFYLDDIAFVGGPISGPTPTPTLGPTLTPLPTPTAVPTTQVTPTITPTRAPTVTVPQGTRLKIMPLGDSITEGPNGGFRNGVYTRMTSAGYSIDMVGSRFDQYTRVPEKEHQGTPGHNTGDIAGGVTGWMNSYNPDVVLLMIGVNDFAWWFIKSVPEVVDGSFDQILKNIYAAKPGVTVVVGSITPMKGTNAQGTSRDSLARQYNSLIQAKVDQYKAQGKRIAFADIYNSITTADLYDDVHPGEAGHEKIAQTWVNALLPVLR